MYANKYAVYNNTNKYVVKFIDWLIDLNIIRLKTVHNYNLAKKKL